MTFVPFLCLTGAFLHSSSGFDIGYSNFQIEPTSKHIFRHSTEESFQSVNALHPQPIFRSSLHQVTSDTSLEGTSSSPFQYSEEEENNGNETAILKKDDLLRLIRSTPRNAPTPPDLTRDILALVRDLEALCPSTDSVVADRLGGNWELLWTTQDDTRPESRRGGILKKWINPLENQSYSNNPNGSEGRFNPILPRAVQDRLESMGIVEPNNSDVESEDDASSFQVVSSQNVDTRRRIIRNVVSVKLLPPSNPFAAPVDGRRGSRSSPRPLRGILSVTIRYRPNENDARRIDVKFDSFRVKLLNGKSGGGGDSDSGSGSGEEDAFTSLFPTDVNFPLGFVGPTGWLRTPYVDETLRITRGHKGSVFVLSRASRQGEK